jgi:hypothetical protein
MPKIIIALLLLLPIKAFSQLPETDIWLMNISIEKGKIGFSSAKNITKRKGYENQPSFSADSKTIYFTSFSDTSTQTDIYTYSFTTQQVKPYTSSGTSEYSPAVNFTGTGLSVLMVEEDSSQRIWEYPISGGKPSRLFAARDSIGYFAWIDANTVLAYILSDGKATPERLSLLKKDGTEKKIAEKVGRGMKVYGKSALFVKKVDTLQYVYLTDFTQNKPLLKVPGKSVDLAVYKNYVLMADGSTIYGARMQVKNKEITGLDAFVDLQDVSGFGSGKISRMAVSPDEKMIAVVVEK